MSTAAPPRPRVFISYSHDTPEHKTRVFALCERLRADGIDATIDQHVETAGPAEGWPRWMDRQLQSADTVILICTQTYRRRLENREEPGRGHGVLWEGHLVYQMIYNAGTRNERFAPVLLAGATPADIPLLLQGGAYYRPDDEGGYEALYRRLTAQPRVVAGPLGPLRELPPHEPPPTGDPGAQTSPARRTTPPSPAPPSRRSITRTAAVLAGVTTAVVIALAVALYTRAPTDYRIRIVVLDPQGQAVNDARITSASGGELQRTDAGWQLLLPGSARPSDGEITLQASVPSAFLAGEAKVRLDDRATLEVRIPLQAIKGAMVTGIVVDSEDRPVEGARVTLVSNGAFVTTGADGRFTLPADAAVGQMIQLRAERSDLQPITQNHPAGGAPATLILSR